MRREQHHGRAGGHRDEVHESHQRTAEAVGQPASDRADERAEQRPEKGQVGRVQRRREFTLELHLKNLAEGEPETDERAERADVEERHRPGVRLPEHVTHGPLVVSRGAEVVHPRPGEQGGEEHEGDVRRDEHSRVVLAGGREHEQCGQLDGGDAEVAAAHPCDRRDYEERRQVNAGLQHDEHEAERGEQEQRAGDGPVAATERRDRKGVGQPQYRADQGRDRREQGLVLGLEAVFRPEEQHQHGPHRPDREADVLGQDREQQVATGGPLAGRRPERRVLGTPVVDPARTGRQGDDGGGGFKGRCHSVLRCRVPAGR